MFLGYGLVATMRTSKPSSHSRTFLRFAFVAWEKSLVHRTTLCPERANALAISQYRWGRLPSVGRLSNGFTIQTVITVSARVAEIKREIRRDESHVDEIDDAEPVVGRRAVE